MKPEETKSYKDYLFWRCVATFCVILGLVLACIVTYLKQQGFAIESLFSTIALGVALTIGGFIAIGCAMTAHIRSIYEAII